MEEYTIRDLTFFYPGQEEPALNGLELTVETGEFLTLCGPSGCGKSTLLRQLKTVLAPNGTRTGEIRFRGAPLESLDLRTQSRRIGFVQQDPENQIVTDKVWHELAFGLESLGLDTPAIRRRVAETASFFGIQTWFYKDVWELSGGQKQLLNLASVMVMQPSVLILDEPTSQLDPIAAADFLSALGRINRELGTTVIITEHRLEEAFARSTSAAVMDRGRILCRGAPREVGMALKSGGHPMFLSMPAAMRIWAAVDSGAPCPVTVGDGRRWLTDLAGRRPLKPLPARPEHRYPEEPVIRGDGLWFRYERELPDVIKGLSFTAKKGEFLAVLGGNGTGKTTLLKLLSGLCRPYRGKLEVTGTVGVLPQDPQTLFVKKTVREDLRELLSGDEEEQEAQTARAAAVCRLETLLDRHPYDLSGGERQRAALAKILLLKPDILLLDEPTKGLDGEFKQTLAELLDALVADGVTVVMVSHDVEFCARHAHRCALFFDGDMVAEGPPERFFAGNSFYTTAANRMARDLAPEAVTAEDVIALCGGRLPPPAESERGTSAPPEPAPGRELPRPSRRDGEEKRDRRAAAVLLLIPLTLLAGAFFPGGRKYYLVSLLMVLEGMLPFFLTLEGRRARTRELVVIAVLCAVGVAGRAAFFMLPQFKPVMALTVIAGAALGGETGFLVGAVTMLVSNIMFSQGPWTPWQMFAMGMVGFLAGILYRKGRLRPTGRSLCVFGAVSAIVVYGGIMNPASALMWSASPSWKAILTYYVSGFPMDCVHAAATGLFLLLAAEPMLEKMERVKLKYGLEEL